MPVCVKNRHMYKGPGHYIGRGTIYGNPYVIGEDGTREEVIAKYRADASRRMREEPEFKKAILALVKEYIDTGELVLICSCRPKPCHGDVIAAAVEKIAASLPRNEEAKMPNKVKDALEKAAMENRKKMQPGDVECHRCQTSGLFWYFNKARGIAQCGKCFTCNGRGFYNPKYGKRFRNLGADKY